ncbi:MAG TPA: RNA 2',3'-cyclic phosphodiesterase [Actinomycetota bacterium]
MKVRLFVALGLLPEVKDELARIAGALAPFVPGALWVPRDNYHLTLAFLGWVADERVPEISDALRQGVAELREGSARLDDLGAFPSERRARVVWVGLADPEGVVEAMAGAVHESMAGIGSPPEERPFRAHVTLARSKTPGLVAFPEDAAPAPLAVPVGRVTLFRSHLRRPAPRYEALAEFPFRRG